MKIQYKVSTWIDLKILDGNLDKILESLKQGNSVYEAVGDCQVDYEPIFETEIIEEPTQYATAELYDDNDNLIWSNARIN